MKKAIIIITIVLMLTGCNSKTNKETDNINSEQLEPEQTEIVDNTNEQSNNEEIVEEKYIVEIQETVKLRIEPNKAASQMGILRKGDRVEVFETINDGEYDWNRIGKNVWFANDGTWAKQIDSGTDIEIKNIDISNLVIPSHFLETAHSGTGEYNSWKIDWTVHKDADGEVSSISYIDDNTGEEINYWNNDFMWGFIYSYHLGKDKKSISKQEYDEYHRLVLSTIDRSDDRIKVVDCFRYDYNGNFVGIYYYTLFNDEGSQHDDYTNYSYRIDNQGRIIEYYDHEEYGEPQYTDIKYYYE